MDKKTVIITAASKGLGRACAQAFAAEDYNLMLFSRSSEVMDLAEELKGEAIQGDITDSSALDNLVYHTIEKFGRIDALVNNTGHPAKGPLMELSDQQWEQGFELLMLNVIRLAKRVVPQMKEQGGGSIVNVSTFAAFEPSPAFPISSVLRAGLGSYTKLFADQMGQYGIRMNSVLPGFMDSFEVSEEIRDSIPLGREASVKEVADTVIFLASEKASYITGQNIRVDGGLSKHV